VGNGRERASGAAVPPDDAFRSGPIPLTAHALLWLATAVTLITGVQYLLQVRKAMADA